MRDKTSIYNYFLRILSMSFIKNYNSAFKSRPFIGGLVKYAFVDVFQR